MSVSTRPATTLPPGLWQADTVHSSVGFAVRHNLISLFRGRFEDYEVRLAVDRAGQAQLTGSASAASIAVEDEALGAHLTAPEFFDSERYPQLRFHSTAVRRDAARLEVDGVLEIKGHRREVSVAGSISEIVADPFSGTRVAIELETTIDRRDYGLEWNMPMPGGGLYLSNDVTLTLTLEFTRTDRA